MAVAKSYQSLPIIKTPYQVGSKFYVQVRLENGTEKQVRWYNDAEYAKMYPGEKADHSADPYYKTQKEVLGFKNGYITIFKGDTYSCKEWFKENGARYTKFWGWSFSSEMEVPEDIPAGVEPMRLEWSVVGDGDRLKNDDLVKAAIEAMTYEPDDSEFVGNIGDRIEVTLTVEKAIHLDGYYGPSTMHIMRDEDGNAFVWTTAAKSWEEGVTKTLRGTIKDHKTYRNVNQTVLTRCKEIATK